MSATETRQRDLTALERQQEEGAKRRVTYWPALFIIALALPFIIDVGALRMTVNRFFLLFVFFPAIIGWIFGKAGKKRTADYFFVAFTLWCQIALVGADGFNESIEAIGMLAIETLGAYFLGRTFVRNKYQFRSVAKTIFWVILVLLPFAFVEAYFNRTVMIDMMSKIWKTLPGVMVDRAGRLGLRRAQVSFEHPILFGLFCSYGYGMASYGLEKEKVGFKAGVRATVSMASTFFSLSTGAYLAIGTQVLLTGWEFMTRTVKNRWKILLIGFVLAYLTVDLISNRSPFEVFVSYMTFDQGTSYNRVLIWRYGTEQLFRTPLFGIGHTGDWIRPWWMHPSMDNFWLLLAVRHGILAFVLFAAGVCFTLRDIGKAVIKDVEVQNMRLGWMFAMVSMFVAICSVHLWNATYVLFMFMLGAGLWLADYQPEEETVEQTAATNDKSEPQRKSGNFRPVGRPNVVRSHSAVSARPASRHKGVHK